jgi:phage terminase large subunit
VNWDWIATRRLSTFDKIKATCDELEMTKMMCFKYSWNREIICQFYSTLYFDADGQRLLWMTDG